MTIPAAIGGLRDLLGARLGTDGPTRAAHGGSESHFAQTPPDAVAFPATTEEVAAILRICADHACPVIGWGTGTSLEGHTMAVRGGVAVSFARMTAIRALNPADMDATVEPGLTRGALNLALRDTGLFFPVDPGADASLGGMAATRASGTTTVRYGSMRDNVRGLEVALPGGEVIRTGGRARKSAAGYDLTALFVGSEGTLGLITALTLRLWPQPEVMAAAVAGFATLQDAISTVQEVIASGIVPARIEFVDAATVRAVNAFGGTGFAPCPTLLVEFHGPRGAVEAEAAAFAAIARDHGAEGTDTTLDNDARAQLWRLRHRAYPAILASRPGARAIVTDVCVPVSALADAVDHAAGLIAQAGLPGPILGHVGDGNFHAILMIDPADKEESARAASVATAMARHALTLGGTVTGEHGVGLGKRGLMAQEHGAAWGIMGRIKHALDPADIMNPGKLIPEST